MPDSSSAVADISYDADLQLMQVTFTSGRIYEYERVPLHEYESFYASASWGRYFNTRIRDAYPWREL